MRMTRGHKRDRYAAEQSGLVEATTNLILLAAVVLIGSLVATTIVGVSLKFMDFGQNNIGDFSEADVRSPGLIAFSFNIDVANSSFGGENSADVILGNQGPNEIWDTVSHDWGKEGPQGLSQDYFAVLMAGYIWCPEQVNVTLQVNVDGLVWVWVDNAHAISTSIPETTLSLSRGYHPLKVKYVALGADTSASFELLWDLSGLPATVGEGNVFY